MAQKAKPYHHGNLKQALIEQALVYLRDRRAEDLSLRELARLSGVSPNAPYRHFSTKDDLLAALAADGFERLSSRIGEVHEEGPVKQFRELAQLFCDFAKDQRALFEIMFSFRHDVEKFSPSLHAARNECFQKVVESVRIVMGRSKPDEEVVEGAAVAWTLLFGFSTLGAERAFPLNLPVRELGGSEAARLLARGLRD